MLTRAKWVLIIGCGLIGLCVAAGGVLVVAVVVLQTIPNPFPETDLSNREPYADVVGREYRLVVEVDALAWNDFPDKATILSISLMRPPSVSNRFVSWKTRLKPGQTIRIIGARGRFGSGKDYVVSVPGAGLPEGIQIAMPMSSDGRPDPNVYEPLGK